MPNTDLKPPMLVRRAEALNGAAVLGEASAPFCREFSRVGGSCDRLILGSCTPLGLPLLFLFVLADPRPRRGAVLQCLGNLAGAVEVGGHD